jgi:SnoaL-like domain
MTSDIEALSRRILELENLVGTLRHKDEIRDLKAAYCRYADSGAGRNWRPDNDEFSKYTRLPWDQRAALISGLFSETGVFEVGGVKKVGRKDIESFFAGPSRLTLAVHMAMNPSITVDGDRAWGIWHMLVPFALDTGVAVWSCGRYEDEFVRTSEGWRIQRMTTFSAFSTPYSEGWARERFMGGH